MDLSMPGMGGAEATRKLLATGIDLRVVVLTSLSERERILDALDAGAIGYLLKDAEPDELIRGVQAAARGESPLSPKAAQQVLAARSDQRPAVELSPREREVLELVGQGLPNKLIARRLEISEKTVKAHLTQVFAQLGVTDRTQAALWLERNGVPDSG
jgi:DNA-binding NarL/FixJ family response regulator